MTSGWCTTWLPARSGLCCCAAMLALTAALHLFWRSSSGREGSLRILQYRQPQEIRAAAGHTYGNLSEEVTCTAPHMDDAAVAGQHGSTECITLRRACLDQSTIVSFNPEHSPEHAGDAMLPEFDTTALMYNWPGKSGNGDSLGPAATRLHYPPLTFRAGTHLDTHLLSQGFSSCTMPVVWFSNFPNTFGEAFVRVPQHAYTWTQQGFIDANVTHVIATPGGLGLSSFWAPMLAPFTTLAVSSLADFSARARQGTPSGAVREGTARQCFARLALCKVHWPDFHGMLEVGQATFAHYSATGQLPADPAGFELPATTEPATLLLGKLSAQLHGRPPLVPGAAAEQRSPLRVLLEQRGGPVRNFVDLPQLLSSCNAAGDTLCRAFTFAGDYARNIAAARSANVLVTIHGSGSNNLMLMEPGSALIEVRPFQFGTYLHDWANAFLPKVCEANEYRVMYFGLNIEDPGLFKPGAYEANNTGNHDPMTRMRDRHVILRWDELQRVLDAVRSARANHSMYLDIVSRGEHILNVLPGGVLAPWIPPYVPPAHEAEAESVPVTRDL